MKIAEISKEIHQNNIEKGFWNDNENKNVGEVLMLIVSELAEALEAHRLGGKCTLSAGHKILLDDKVEDKVFVDVFEGNVKDSFEDELADVAIRLFDACEGFNIDLTWHIQQKLRYNKTRPYKHNKAY